MTQINQIIHVFFQRTSYSTSLKLPRPPSRHIFAQLSLPRLKVSSPSCVSNQQKSPSRTHCIAKYLKDTHLPCLFLQASGFVSISLYFQHVFQLIGANQFEAKYSFVSHTKQMANRRQTVSSHPPWPDRITRGGLKLSGHRNLYTHVTSPQMFETNTRNIRNVCEFKKPYNSDRILGWTNFSQGGANCLQQS